eukprot:snap_masked-scaffold_36-processed-gene-1.19-mRNA-1 protein AED:1.00 eAED:1.00 QI:0/-1/0/0/-1/1/1/0/115
MFILLKGCESFCQVERKFLENLSSKSKDFVEFPTDLAKKLITLLENIKQAFVDKDKKLFKTKKGKVDSDRYLNKHILRYRKSIILEICDFAGVLNDKEKEEFNKRKMGVRKKLKR